MESVLQQSSSSSPLSCLPLLSDHICSTAHCLLHSQINNITRSDYFLLCCIEYTAALLPLTPCTSFSSVYQISSIPTSQMVQTSAACSITTPPPQSPLQLLHRLLVRLRIYLLYTFIAIHNLVPPCLSDLLHSFMKRNVFMLL